jgi:hypothetical protein
VTRIRVGWWAVATVLAIGLPVRATVMVPVDLPVLSRDAATIVRGTVAAVDARWVGRDIESLVTLEVEASMKGGDASIVQFRVPGGQVGRYRRMVIGAPAFLPGQRIVVFLSAASANAPHLVGFSQGVFRVESTTAGYRVTPPIPPAADGRVVRGDRNLRPLSLAEFERQVRQFVEAAR